MARVKQVQRTHEQFPKSRQIARIAATRPKNSNFQSQPPKSRSPDRTRTTITKKRNNAKLAASPVDDRQRQRTRSRSPTSTPTPIRVCQGVATRRTGRKPGWQDPLFIPIKCPLHALGDCHADSEHTHGASRQRYLPCEDTVAQTNESPNTKEKTGWDRPPIVCTRQDCFITYKHDHGHTTRQWLLPRAGLLEDQSERQGSRDDDAKERAAPKATARGEDSKAHEWILLKIAAESEKALGLDAMTSSAERVRRAAQTMANLSTEVALQNQRFTRDMSMESDSTTGSGDENALNREEALSEQVDNLSVQGDSDGEEGGMDMDSEPESTISNGQAGEDIESMRQIIGTADNVNQGEIDINQVRVAQEPSEADFVRNRLDPTLRVGHIQTHLDVAAEACEAERQNQEA